MRNQNTWILLSTVIEVLKTSLTRNVVFISVLSFYLPCHVSCSFYLYLYFCLWLSCHSVFFCLVVIIFIFLVSIIFIWLIFLIYLYLFLSCPLHHQYCQHYRDLSGRLYLSLTCIFNINLVIIIFLYLNFSICLVVLIFI